MGIRIGKAEEILAKEGRCSGEKMGMSIMGKGKRGEGKRVGEKRDVLPPLMSERAGES